MKSKRSRQAGQWAKQRQKKKRHLLCSCFLHAICIICQNKHNTLRTAIQRNTKCCFWYMRATLRMRNLATHSATHTHIHKKIYKVQKIRLFFCCVNKQKIHANRIRRKDESEKTINACRTWQQAEREQEGEGGEGCLERANPTNTRKPNGCRLLANPSFMLKSNNNKKQQNQQGMKLDKVRKEV